MEADGFGGREAGKPAALYRPWEVLTDALPSASRSALIRQELPRPVLGEADTESGCS